MDDVELIISSNKPIIEIILLCFFLMVWLCAEILMLSAIFGFFDIHSKTYPVFIFLFLIFNFFGFLIIKTLLWILKGKEIITITREAVIINKKASLFFKEKFFYLNKIKNIRVREELYGFLGFFHTTYDFGFFVSNTIRFDYDGKMGEFGSGLEEITAWEIVQLLKDKFLPAA